MNFQHYINLICRPNPQAIKDDAEREIAFNRNKSVLFIEIFSFVSMAVYILATNRLPTPVQNISFLTIIFILSFFLLTCRSYPNVFRVFYFTVVTMFGPLAQYYNKDSIFFNCVGVYILPTWMLYLSGSKLLFFLQLLIQAGYMHGLYKPLLIETLHNMTPEAYVHRLVNITTFGIFINCTFLLTTHMALLKAYTKISVTRSKKEDLERQKIFLLGFSHELRNLINSMIGNIQLCTLEVVNEKVRGLLQNSQVCGELLMHLVTNILDTGKAAIGDLEINPTPNYIHETLEKLWNVCSQLIKNKRLAGVMRIQEKIPELLEFDNYRVTQILMNLVGNSIKYTDQGIIQVTIDWLRDEGDVTDKCFEPKPFDDEDEGVFEKSQTLATLLRQDLITLDLDKKKRIPRENIIQEDPPCKQGILKIIVSDSGPGISGEKLGVLFKKFPQISGELSKKRLGTGLGLFVTKELIEKMKGEVRVYSKEGIGTVFIACIPVKVVPGHVPVNIGMDAFLNVLGSLNLRTMIVDDMDFNVIVIKNYLSKLGLKVTDVARNGKEAVDKFMESSKNRQVFDIITMDIEMPVMDGKEAIKRIRAFEKQNGLVSSLIMVISGNCSESEVGECLDARGVDGANVFLKKPVSIEDLSRIIKLAFEKRVWTLSQGNKGS